MTVRLAPKGETRPQQPASSLVEWTHAINMLAARASRKHEARTKTPGTRARRSDAVELLVTDGDVGAGENGVGTRARLTFGYRMAHDVAEHLVGEIPLRRARTPWGMSKVQSMLVSLRYGGAA